MDVDSYWNDRKQELLDSIDAAMEREGSDKATLAVMKELLEKAKIRTSIQDFYEDQK